MIFESPQFTREAHVNESETKEVLAYYYNIITIFKSSNRWLNYSIKSAITW